MSTLDPSTPERIYIGRRERNGTYVTVTTGDKVEALNPRFDLWNHSPTGFEWGYNGSGPAQLALALVADVTREDEIALRCYQAFKRMIVAHIKADCWAVGENLLGKAILEILEERTRRAVGPLGEPECENC